MTTISEDEFFASFLASGWVQAPVRDCYAFFQKRLRKGDATGYDDQARPVCLTNEALYLNAHVYWHVDRHGFETRSVEFEIVGEYKADSWTNLKLYSFTWDKAATHREEIQEELTVSWDALCMTGRPLRLGGEDVAIFGKKMKMTRAPSIETYELGEYYVDGFFLNPCNTDDYLLAYPVKGLCVRKPTIREAEAAMSLLLKAQEAAAAEKSNEI